MNATALCDDLVAMLLAAGAGVAEVFFEQAYVRKVSLENGELRERSASITRGVGMRIEVDGRAGFASASDLRPTVLRGLAVDLVQGCRLLPEAPGPTVPDTPLVWPESADEDPALAAMGEVEQLALVRELAAESLRSDPRVTAVARVLVQTAAREVALASSAGRRAAHRWTTVSGGVGALAERGAERSLYYGTASARRLADFRAVHVAKGAAQTAALLLGGRPVPSQRCPVLFAPVAMARVLQTIAPSFSGESALRGHSVFAGRIGSQIAAAAVSFVEDPFDSTAFGYAPFDHEGTPPTRLALVANGQLRALAHTASSAARSGTSSTGNGWRGSYRTPPTVTFANLGLCPGARSTGELLHLLGTGLYVLEVTMQGGFQPQVGALTMSVSGLWVEGGEPARPVRGVTIACGVEELLRSIAAVGNDLARLGTYRAPSVLCDPLSVSGSA